MKRPPFGRSRIALGLTAAAALGRFELQVCRDCAAVQYPPREACHCCLSPTLDWTAQSGRGELISETTLFHSNEPFFRQRLPCRVGLVRLDCGATAVTFISDDVDAAPSRVRVNSCLDRAGSAVLIAFPAKETGTEMELNPRHRKILVTDASTPVGEALVRALLEAGAERVWAGTKEPEHPAGVLSRVDPVHLDLTQHDSVSRLRAEMGADVDILINNSEVHGTSGIAAPNGVDIARAEMDINYFGLLRLAQEFGPVMCSRTSNSSTSLKGWVNVLSIYALTNFPVHGTFSASKAAAHSLAQCLRSQMYTAGVRVINVFPGPIDCIQNDPVPTPKLSPTALAKGILKALIDGVEDAYPGDVAQEWLARWRENPKVLEREVAMTGRS